MSKEIELQNIISTPSKSAIDAVSKSKVLVDASVQEASKYSKQDNELLGSSFQICETGVKYDYTRTDVWCEVQSKIESLKEKQKQIEALAKNTRTVTIYVDEHGEEHTVYAATKRSTTNVKITLSK